MNRSMNKIIFSLILVVVLSIAVLHYGNPTKAEPLDDRNSQFNQVQLASTNPLSFPSPRGTGASFYHVPGSVFNPTDSATVIVTGYYGCFYLGSISSYSLNAPLEVPNGARITQLRLFYYDTAGGGIDSWIYRYNDLSTTMENIAYVESEASPGHNSSYVDLDHTVDNYNYKYVLLVRLNGANSNIQVCGMRVTYYP